MPSKASKVPSGESIKGFKKSEREIRVLFGLIQLYINTLKPVGSNNLKESGFEDISSATIRNYFAKFEMNGLVEQPHTSGGRIPTWRAFKLFANTAARPKLPTHLSREISQIAKSRTKQVLELLQQTAEKLSTWTGGATFLSMPHFEQDSIIDMHLVKIDSSRLLGVLVTSFGGIQTHTLRIDQKLSELSLGRIEQCLKAELLRARASMGLSTDERALAQTIYQELLTRYLLGQSESKQAGPFKAGFSHLLKHPIFRDANSLSAALELFESQSSLTTFTRAPLASNGVHAWIGEELLPYAKGTEQCAIIAINYQVGSIPVGTIGLLLPLTSDFPAMMTLLESLSSALSKALESNISTHKLTWTPAEAKASPLLLAHRQTTLEHKREST